MAIRIESEFIALEVNGGHRDCPFSQYAAADGDGAWIVSTHHARLFGRSQAMTALALAQRLAVGYVDDPRVITWRKELFL
jgi:hypothetical protein